MWDRLPDALLDGPLGGAESVQIVSHMLFNGRDLALDVEVVVPHSEIKSAMIFGLSAGHLLELFTI